MSRGGRGAAEGPPKGRGSPVGRAVGPGGSAGRRPRRRGAPPPPCGAPLRFLACSRPVESWCWVLDFHGFSVRDCDPRLAKARPGSQGLTAAAGQKLAAETAPHPPPAAPRKLPPPRPAACLQIFLNLSAAHYPERLGTFFVVSAPSVFNTLWRAISHFIDPVTKQKVRLCWPPLMAPVSLQACSSAAASPPALWAPPRPPTSDPFPPSLPPPHPPPPPPPTDPFRELQPQGQQQAGGAARCAPLQHPQLRVESTPIS